jgi:hypothetical protein
MPELTIEDFKNVEGYNDSYWSTIPEQNREGYRQLYAFFKIQFPTPAHLVAFYDPALRDGNYKFHSWQAKIHSEHLSKKYSSEDPLEIALLAVNGSGKDKMVIAPFVVQFLMTNIMATITTTSSSAIQLNNQTEKYIRLLAERINSYHGFVLFEIVQRRIKCLITGSEIYLYATDDPGKAEGYHPVDPGRAYAIIVNEAKSIDEKIFEALTRCTGFTHWVEVSSPGKPEGHFYQMCTSTRTKRDKDNNVIPAVNFIRVTSDDCPHLGVTYKDRIKEIYGEHHHLYKSMVLAEFSSANEQVVLPFEKWDRCIKYPAVWIPDANGNIGGLDLSMGGDEQVLTVRNGNKVLIQLTWRIKDVTELVDKLEKAFRDYKLVGRPIYADAGGHGKHFIDLLRMRGWKNIQYVYNQGEPKDIKSYKNIGTEMWFNLATLIENQDILFEDKIVQDPILKKQACNRYYKFVNKDDTTVATLETKPQARAKGHPSPDRADSLALCFLNYKTPSQVKLKNEKLKKLEEEFKHRGVAPTIAGFVKSATRIREQQVYMQKNGIINATDKSSVVARNNDIKLELKQTLEHYNIPCNFKNN